MSRPRSAKLSSGTSTSGRSPSRSTGPPSSPTPPAAPLAAEARRESGPASNCLRAPVAKNPLPALPRWSPAPSCWLPCLLPGSIRPMPPAPASALARTPSAEGVSCVETDSLWCLFRPVAARAALMAEPPPSPWTMSAALPPLRRAAEGGASRRRSTSTSSRSKSNALTSAATAP
jgi:hypothetical protein